MQSDLHFQNFTLAAAAEGPGIEREACWEDPAFPQTTGYAICSGAFMVKMGN